MAVPRQVSSVEEPEARRLGFDDECGVFRGVRFRSAREALIPLGFARIHILFEFREHGLSSQFKNNNFADVSSGSKEGSYLRLIDFFKTHSRFKSNEEDEDVPQH